MRLSSFQISQIWFFLASRSARISSLDLTTSWPRLIIWTYRLTSLRSFSLRTKFRFGRTSFIGKMAASGFSNSTQLSSPKGSSMSPSANWPFLIFLIISRSAFESHTFLLFRSSRICFHHSGSFCFQRNSSISSFSFDLPTFSPFTV